MTDDELRAIREGHARLDDSPDCGPDWTPELSQMHADRAAVLAYVDELRAQVLRLRDEMAAVRAHAREWRDGHIAARARILALERVVEAARDVMRNSQNGMYAKQLADALDEYDAERGR